MKLAKQGDSQKVNI